MNRRASTSSEEDTYRLVNTKAPLLVRLLAALPGPWWAWTILLSLINLAITAAVEATYGLHVPSFLGVVLWSVGCALGGWATFWSWQRIETLRPLVARLTGEAAEDPFKGSGNSLWPLTFTTLAPLSYLAAFVSGFPLVVVLVLYVGSFVSGFLLMSAFWMYVVVALGKHRLGQRPLWLEPFERDRSLGLRPLGSLAFGFYLLYAGINTSLTLATSYSLLSLMQYLLFAIIGLTLFFMQMRGLRRQMLVGKASYIAWARDLYAAAVEPLRRDPSPETLDRQARRVTAAAEIKREVAVIQEWPVDDTVLRTVVAIGTSIVTAILIRLIQSRVGL